METKSLKALADKVLDGNANGNNTETMAQHHGNIYGNFDRQISTHGNMRNKPVRYAVLIWSEILQSHLWMIDETDRERLINTENVYSLDEIQRLKGVTEEHLKAVHEAKTVFPNSRVIKQTKERT